MENKIIVAPLNWGLGHAARCIPIIKALLKSNYCPVIASDGQALLFLRKEFPQLEFLELPSYNIRYSKKLLLGLLLKTPGVLKVLREEHQLIKEYQSQNDLKGIISDNRFGIRHPKVPSVYISHQINVISGPISSIASWVHQRIIKKFDVCWVPDNMVAPYLSGKLSKSKLPKLKFIGALSRFKKVKLPLKYDITVVLSGPEPYRSALEKLLLDTLGATEKKVLFVRGIFGETELPKTRVNICLKNYLLSEQLQEALNQSKLIICRSGYSSILDLAKLEKKAFFIPTPGQFEQEYLAQRMHKMNIAPFIEQEQFKIEQLEKIKDYKGFQNSTNPEIDTALFNLFKSK